MDSRELRSILRSDEALSAHSVGVFPYDKLPAHQPGFIICNLDKSTEPGSHWVALFSQRHMIIDVFDSYGSMPDELSSYTKDCKVNYNSIPVQGILSTTCGQHCIYFGYHRCRGIGFQQIVASYSNDREANDQMVCEFVEETFGVSTDTLDDDMMIMQISKALHPR